MNQLVLFVSLTLCAIAQAVLPHWHTMAQAKAPVLLGGVMYYALTRRGGVALEAAIIAGFLQDVLDFIPLGYSMFAFALAAQLVNRYRTRVFGGSWVTHMLLGAMASVLTTLVLYTLLVATGVDIAISIGAAFRKALGVAFMGLFVISLVFWAIERLDYRLGNIRHREF